MGVYVLEHDVLDRFHGTCELISKFGGLSFTACKLEG